MIPLTLALPPGERDYSWFLPLEEGGLG